MLAIRKEIGSWFLIDTRTAFNREAVTSQSPGLLQPWGIGASFNPERVAPVGRNRVAVESDIQLVPRVAAAATLGSGTQPLCGRKPIGIEN